MKLNSNSNWSLIFPFTLILLLHYQLCLCQITFYTTHTITSGGVPLTLDSISFAQKTIFFKIVQKNNQPNLLSFPPISGKAYLYNLSSTQQLRNSDTNQIGLLNNFTSFTSNAVKLYLKNFKSSLPILTLSNGNQSIVECFCGVSCESNVVLVRNFTRGALQGLYYRMGQRVGGVDLGVGVGGVFVGGWRVQGGLYLQFQGVVLVYAFNQTLDFIASLPLPPGPNISLTINNSYLAYSSDTQTHLHSTLTPSYPLISTITLPSPITSLKLVPPYLLLSTASTLYQYDLDIGVMIAQFGVGFDAGGYRFGVVGNSVAFYAVGVVRELRVFGVDGKLSCAGGCASCPVTYSYDAFNLWCYKNSSSPGYTPPSSPTPPPSSTDPLTSLLTSILAHTLTFSSIRITPKTLLTLTFFIDDIQYYNYHLHNYTSSVLFFMRRSLLINEVRLSAWMMGVVEGVNRSVVCVGMDGKFLGYVGGVQGKGEGKGWVVRPDHVYYLTASQSNYKSYFAVVLLIYLSLKLLHLLSIPLRSYHPSLSTLHSFLKKKTKPHFLLIAFFQANMADLSYNSFLQLKYAFRFSFENSVNLCVCVVGLAAGVWYTLVLYLMVWGFRGRGGGRGRGKGRERKGRGKDGEEMGKKMRGIGEELLVRSGFQLRSFFNQGFSMFLRAIAKSMIHVFLLESYTAQITSLLLIDILLLTLTILNRKTYQTLPIYVCFLGYNLSFLTLNLSFLLSTLRPELSLMAKYDTVNFMVILVIIGFALLAVFVMGVFDGWRLGRKVLRWWGEREERLRVLSEKNAVILQRQESWLNGPCPTPALTHFNPKSNLSKISLNNFKSPSTLKRRLSKSIKQISNKTVTTRQQQSQNLSTLTMQQGRSLSSSSKRVKGLLKIKKEKVKKYASQNRDLLRKIIRLESQKWTLHFTEEKEEKEERDKEEEKGKE